MSTIQGKVALVTGGASGLGKILSRKLLEEGASTLVLWDIHAETLEATCHELSRLGRVIPYVVDVADVEQVVSTSRRVLKEAKPPGILINNAGIVVGKEFLHHTHHEIARTLRVNTTALMHVTREFLPPMLAQGSGHIVNIASAAGMVSNPKMSVYCGSKWAVIGWSESLDTGMFSGVRSRFIPILKPEPVARRIIQGIKNDAIFLRMPRLLRLLPLFQALLPARWFDTIVGKWLGVYKGMETFRGHTAGGLLRAPEVTP